MIRAKTFLKQLYQAEYWIKACSDELNLLSDNFSIASSAMDGVRVQTSLENKLENSIINLVDSRIKLVEKILYWQKVKADIEDTLGRLEDPVAAQILTLRYRDKKTLSAISKELGYSERHLNRLYSKALMDIEDIINAEDADYSKVFRG